MQESFRSFICYTVISVHGYLRRKKTASPCDPTVGICLGSKDGPMEGRRGSDERGTAVQGYLG